VIGVFDSGFGGLTVLRSLVARLPQYDYFYLGDSARAPYGSHSLEVVHSFTREAVEFLFEAGCPLVVACLQHGLGAGTAHPAAAALACASPGSAYSRRGQAVGGGSGRSATRCNSRRDAALAGDRNRGRAGHRGHGSLGIVRA
jgi:hypothetical protein